MENLNSGKCMFCEKPTCNSIACSECWSDIVQANVATDMVFACEITGEILYSEITELKRIFKLGNE